MTTIKRELSFEVNNHLDLNKMLLGLLMDVRRGEVESNITRDICLVVDKLNKNNVNALVYKKLSNHNKDLVFFEIEKEKKIK